MKKWLSENIVFTVTVLIAIAVIVFGATFSDVLADWSGALMSWVSIPTRLLPFLLLTTF